MNSPKQVAAEWKSLTAQGTHGWREPDPIETLKQRYVSGFDTLEEFERYLETELRAERA